jgi:hypothetical protein
MKRLLYAKGQKINVDSKHLKRLIAHLTTMPSNLPVSSKEHILKSSYHASSPSLCLLRHCC